MKAPRTELQIAAACANGAKSRGPITAKGKRVAAANAAHAIGPVTPEGKARSAQNAIRHGLLADTLVFPGESEERFCDLLATLEQKLQRAPGVETDQVHLIAVAHWRRMRLWSVEKSQYLEETPNASPQPATARRQTPAKRPSPTSSAPSAPSPTSPAPSNCSIATKAAIAGNTGTLSPVSKTTAPIRKET